MKVVIYVRLFFFFFQAEDGIRDVAVTGVQTCALPISFAHASGIHQDGLLKEKTTYEIMRPESVGLGKSTLVMGKLSGRHAFRQRLEELGFKPTEEELNRAFERFKRLADQKKEIY